MKITGNHGISISIISGRDHVSLLKSINPGDHVTASVIRSEGNKALLEIGGKTITAEFTNGVPREKLIELVLTSKSADSFQFAIKENQASDKIWKFLNPFNLLNEDEFKKSSLQNFARFINTAKPDLADINLFLLGLKKDEGKDKKGPAFFNHLLQKGVPFQTLIDLSYIIYSKYNPLLFLSYQSLLAMAGKKPYTPVKENLEFFEHIMDEFCDILQGNESDFSIMLELIFDEHKNSDMYGELVFPDDNNFSGVDFIIKGDSVFLKFDLSSAGVLEVFIKSEKKMILINFLSGDERVLDFMKENEDVLKNMLYENDVKKSIIGYFDSKKIVDKLELWSLDFYSKSEFNVKV